MSHPIVSLECPGKSSWPELVGTAGEAATATIEKENPYVNAIVVSDELAPVTGDLDCSRVWVIVDSHGVVTRTPVVG